MEAEPFVTAIAVRTHDPLLDMSESTRGSVEVFLGGPVDWDGGETEACRIIDEIIEVEGVFRTEISSISFLCN